jgi:hypothetical protein
MNLQQSDLVLEFKEFFKHTTQPILLKVGSRALHLHRKYVESGDCGYIAAFFEIVDRKSLRRLLQITGERVREDSNVCDKHCRDIIDSGVLNGITAALRTPCKE